MFDIYEVVTNRVIAELEKGNIIWRKPWNTSTDYAWSRATGKGYSLLNSLCLDKSGEYATFNQIKAEGGRVNKGARASMVIYYSLQMKDRKDADGNIIKDADGNVIKRVIPFLKYHNVFHVETQTNLEQKYNKAETSDVEPIERAEEIISEYIGTSGVLLKREQGNRACYSPSADCVTVPDIKQFSDTAEYYSTVFHELSHSTGHETRLNRITETAFFGNEEYSKEELIAELSASAILNRIGIETASSFKNNVAYIQSWIAALRNDKKLIVQASSKADAAFKMIMGEVQ